MLRVMWSIHCMIQSPTLEPDASLCTILLRALAEVVGVAAEVGIVPVVVTTVVVSMVDSVVIVDSFRNDKSAKPLSPDVGTAKPDGLCSVIKSVCQLVLVLGAWMPKSHCWLTLMLIGTRWAVVQYICNSMYCPIGMSCGAWELLWRRWSEVLHRLTFIPKYWEASEPLVTII